MKRLASIEDTNEKSILENMPFNRKKQVLIENPSLKKNGGMQKQYHANREEASENTTNPGPIRHEDARPKPLDLSIPFDKSRLLASQSNKESGLHSKETGVYVRNIPEHITNPSLYTLFKNFNVLKIIRRGSRASVTFGSYIEAQYLCDQSSAGKITLGDNTLKIKIRQNWKKYKIIFINL